VVEAAKRLVTPSADFDYAMDALVKALAGVDALAPRVEPQPEEAMGG
jgi:hypothetical protein